MTVHSEEVGDGARSEERIHCDIDGTAATQPEQMSNSDTEESERSCGSFDGDIKILMKRVLPYSNSLHERYIYVKNAFFLRFVEGRSFFPALRDTVLAYFHSPYMEVFVPIQWTFNTNVERPPLPLVAKIPSFAKETVKKSLRGTNRKLQVPRMILDRG